MKRQLYLVKLLSNTDRRLKYVVAKSPEEAIKKAEKRYPYYSVYIYEELGEVLV